MNKRLLRIIIGGAVFFSALIFFWLMEREILWLKISLYSVAFLVTGSDILLKAARNILRGRVFDENLLMAIATIGAFIIGEYPEAVAVMLFYQVGEYFQGRAVGKSRKSIAKLMDIRPDYANVLENGTEIRKDPSEVKVDDTIIIAPGERIPLDGIVLSGFSSVDTSALTGESLPRGVSPSDEVISGCINQSGVLTVRVTKTFGESTVSKILDLVENASGKKSAQEKFITKFARYYTPSVVIIAVLLAVLPPLITGASFSSWLYIALSFLVASCPCALVISVPMSFFGGLGGASRCGILIKGSNYLEALAKTDTVVFDKTGTLTEGKLSVQKIAAVGMSEDALLEFAAYVECFSNHPIAQSLCNVYAERMGAQLSAKGEVASTIVGGSNTTEETCLSKAGNTEDLCDCDKFAADKTQRVFENSKSDNTTTLAKTFIDKSCVSEVSEIAGQGITALVKGRRVAAGNAVLMVSMGIDAPLVEDVGTVVYVAVDEVYAGYILIADEIKPDSFAAIKMLKAAGIKQTVMLTGDVDLVGRSVANSLGIDRVYTQLLPANKVERFEELLQQDVSGGKRKDKRRKGRVAFAGDGINDAPVLARADVGIAMGALGSDAAIEAADVVIMDDSPSKIATAKRIAARTLSIAYQNILFAIVVKTVVLVLIAFGVVGMWMAIIADVGVTILAVLNAFRALSTRQENNRTKIYT